MAKFLIAALFGLIYIAIYPTLVGNFVIYRSPPLTTTQALVYLGSGILIQLLFFIPKVAVKLKRPMLVQLASGFIHLMLYVLLPGNTYMS